MTTTARWEKIDNIALIFQVCSNGISIKLEGLEGLNEIAKLYPELCQQNLSQLIATLFPLTSHIESRVRTASRSLIQSVLNKVPSQHLTPLNSVINAHVCCGLSHIDTNIQLDSLKLLDVVSSYYNFMKKLLFFFIYEKMLLCVLILIFSYR